MTESTQVALQREIEQLAARIPGTTAVVVRDLAGGGEIAMRAAEPIPTASLVKLPLLAAAYALAEQGVLDLDRRVPFRAADIEPPEIIHTSGALRFFGPGLEPRVGDLLTLAIVLSDNLATNLALREIGLERVNRWLEQAGFSVTRFLRPVFAPDETASNPELAARFGLGVTTPAEMTEWFSRLHRGTLVSPTADGAMLDILRRQQVRTRLPRGLPVDEPGFAIAHKTGEMATVRHDVGLITASGGVAYVIGLFVTELADTRRRTPDHPAYLVGAELARLVHRALSGR